VKVACAEALRDVRVSEEMKVAVVAAGFGEQDDRAKDERTDGAEGLFYEH
jgi:hypothetical protein